MPEVVPAALQQLNARGLVRRWYFSELRLAEELCPVKRQERASLKLRDKGFA
jgi:hypothetical protein